MADPLSTASEVLAVLELCDRVLAALDQTPNATNIRISNLDELRAVLEEFMLNLRAFVSLFEGNTSAFPRDIMEHFEKELRGSKQLLELFLQEFHQLTRERRHRPVTFQTQLWKTMRDLGSRVRTTTLSLDRLRQAVLSGTKHRCRSRRRQCQRCEGTKLRSPRGCQRKSHGPARQSPSKILTFLSWSTSRKA
ncbi:hypothetical protein BDW71DRAFT_117923 [Aspergillus fruticulosus]